MNACAVQRILPPVMRIKPAHCSNAFGPSFATFRSSFLLSKRPFSLAVCHDVFAITLLTPEMYSSSDAGCRVQIDTDFIHAVLNDTAERPRRASSGSYRADTGRHRWISGSILTSSASGSCTRRAMEAALRCPTSKFGNSSVASLLCGVNGRSCLVCDHIHNLLRDLF